MRYQKIGGSHERALSVEAMPLAELETWIADGRLRDGRAIAGLLLARAYLWAETSGPVGRRTDHLKLAPLSSTM